MQRRFLDLAAGFVNGTDLPPSFARPARYFG